MSRCRLMTLVFHLIVHRHPPLVSIQLGRLHSFRRFAFTHARLNSRLGLSSLTHLTPKKTTPRSRIEKSFHPKRLNTRGTPKKETDKRIHTATILSNGPTVTEGSQIRENRHDPPEFTFGEQKRNARSGAGL